MLTRLFLMVACLATPALAAPADDDATIVDDATLILDSKSQQQADIKTQRLQAASNPAEFTALGLVVDLTPLLTVRQQYLATSAQQQSAQAKYQEADTNLNRSRNLHQQDIISTRRLQEQQSQWQADKANLANHAYQQQAILENSRLQWGDTLSHWFTQTNSQQLNSLLTHHSQLLEIVLAANQQLPTNTKHIMIDEHGNRQQAISASLIDAAPQVDSLTQGLRYFFISQGRHMAYGSHLTAWIASPDPASSTSNAAAIPDSSVVWHLGKAYVFIKNAEQRFQRRLLGQATPSSQGYYLSNNFKLGEEIVTRGAQTLLSQQLKNLIPSEDSD